MKIIIVGCGKVGDLLVSYISREGHDVVVVDTDQSLIENVVNEYDVMGVVGNGAGNAILLEAGANKADLLIAVTASDELNLMCCTIARALGTRHTIARVRNPEYSDQTSFMHREFGLSMIVNPEYDAAREIYRILRFPAALRIDTFNKGRVDLVEVKLSQGHPLCGHSLKELSSVCTVDILVCAVSRDGEVTIPSGDFVLNAGDVIHITATHNNLSKFFRELGIVEKRIRSVMLIGGGKISYFLAKMLESADVDVKLLEIDRDRAELLSQMLPKATIIHGDGSDSDVLLEEGIDRVDAVVSLTDFDEENIITSLYASTRNVGKIITKVNRLNVMKLLSSIGLECVVSPRSITANSILRYLRALENSDSASIQTLYKLVEGKVEALEFVVSEGFEHIGVPIKQMDLRKNILLACIIRGNRVIYPHGDDTIEAGDSVIVVAKSEDPVLELEDIVR